jgi:CheY-like chemotaxis protein
MRKKILLVDDTLTVRTLEKMLLGDEYDYIEASNGKEAFDMAIRRSPDLILMDINMPVEPGVEALKRLKAESRTAHVPVVMVSARGEEEMIKLCTSLGCNAYITKPLKRDVLQATIKRFLS